MGLEIKGRKELRERLQRLRAEEVMARALAQQAERMAGAVREGLSDPPMIHTSCREKSRGELGRAA